MIARARSAIAVLSQPLRYAHRLLKVMLRRFVKIRFRSLSMFLFRRLKVQCKCRRPNTSGAEVMPDRRARFSNAAAFQRGEKFFGAGASMSP
jgi:hypothetical protein